MSLHYHTTYTSYSRGVSVLVHKLLPFQLLDIRTDPGGCYIVMHVLITNVQCVLVGLYLLPPVDAAILSTIMQILLSYGVEDVLLMSDFHMSPCPDLDRLHSTSHWSLGFAQWASMFALTDKK